MRWCGSVSVPFVFEVVLAPLAASAAIAAAPVRLTTQCCMCFFSAVSRQLFFLLVLSLLVLSPCLRHCCCQLCLWARLRSTRFDSSALPLSVFVSCFPLGHHHHSLPSLHTPTAFITSTSFFLSLSLYYHSMPPPPPLPFSSLPPSLHRVPICLTIPNDEPALANLQKRTLTTSTTAHISSSSHHPPSLNLSLASRLGLHAAERQSPV